MGGPFWASPETNAAGVAPRLCASSWPPRDNTTAMRMQLGAHRQSTKRGLTGLALTLMVIIGVRLAHQGDRLVAADAASTQGASDAVMPVPVTTVVQQTVPIYLEYVGTTDPVRNVTLEAQVTGYLTRHPAPDGADVHKGQLLYQIDPRAYQAALSQAQAERDGAAIANAELNLSYTSIRAPFTGRLSLTRVHEGALISAAGTQLNTLVQLDPIYATFKPPVRDLAQIEQAQSHAPVPVDVMVDQSQRPSYNGTLSFLDNSVDRTSGTITMRATIGNPEHRLLPGQFVRVRLHIGDVPNALLVPDVAVNSSRRGAYVYVVGRGDHIEQRYVTLGASYGSLVVANRGVRAGEYVLVGDLLQASPGMQVRPQPQSAAAAPTASTTASSPAAGGGIAATIQVNSN